MDSKQRNAKEHCTMSPYLDLLQLRPPLPTPSPPTTPPVTSNLPIVHPPPSLPSSPQARPPIPFLLPLSSLTSLVDRVWSLVSTV
ncbi:hypothetical protein E2C01_087372 [Portunus trituberculatus]|uniref:Uncharacterized protein n=1 Tax=Portunus trituberculatus TaxID=210409 RepID=A0A5B7J7X9_PORTR|nr:hypothetical protein [Portunus trituberculatus]